MDFNSLLTLEGLVNFYQQTNTEKDVSCEEADNQSAK